MVIEYENTLRRLIIQNIGENDDSPYNISNDRIEKWKDKREVELKKNNGILFENRLLFYSDFYDLKNIIDKNWSLFLPILKDKKRFDVFFDEVENYRNTLAHGRVLISGQKSLLEGIVSDLKNLITRYHNKNEQKEDFFIEILKVNDNLGNVWLDPLDKNQPILRVGDEYELIIDANDPKDRKIEYEINKFPNFRISQESNHFKFKIGKELIGKNFTLNIIAKTPNSDYENRIQTFIMMTVLPE